MRSESFKIAGKEFVVTQIGDAEVSYHSVHYSCDGTRLRVVDCDNKNECDDTFQMFCDMLEEIGRCITPDVAAMLR